MSRSPLKVPYQRQSIVLTSPSLATPGHSGGTHSPKSPGLTEPSPCRISGFTYNLIHSPKSGELQQPWHMITHLCRPSPDSFLHSHKNSYIAFASTEPTAFETRLHHNPLYQGASSKAVLSIDSTQPPLYYHELQYMATLRVN